MTSRPELLERFDTLFDHQFPNKDDHADWAQHSYKDQWFDLCRDSVGTVNQTDVTDHLKRRFKSPPGQMLPDSQLSADQETDLNELLLAWREWQYAMNRIAKSQ